MRGWIALLLIASLAIAAAFLADHPGRVDILWQGYEIQTSAALLLAGAALLGVLAAAAAGLIRLVLRSPAAFLRRRRDRRRRQGYRALTQGMVAVAAGDPQEARRHARKADLLLAEPPLTLLLSAQAAQLDGDEGAAKKFFAAMLERPETEFLGLRGLLNQALREGDRTAALGLAERARGLRPNARWVVESLFDLAVRDGRWETARERLADAQRLNVLAPERARHHRGVILYELSLAAARAGERKRALALAADARAPAPDLAALAAHQARLLVQDGQMRAAARAIERAWRTAAAPELARAYGAIFADEPALSRVKCFERLAEQNNTARESHLAVAEAALDAALWGEARRHLEAALAAPPPPRAGAPGAAAPPSASGAAASEPALPTPRLCRLMARLEEAELGQAGHMREWLDRALGALPDPLYVCTNCGGESLDWHSVCPSCGGFDALFWRTPTHAPFALPPAQPRAAGPANAAPAALPAANAGDEG